MLAKRFYFKRTLWPYLLVAPQVLLTLVFFVWPALTAIKQSFFRGDAFGLHSTFVGLSNFYELYTSPTYINSLKMTFVFSVGVVFFAVVPALFIAVLVDRVIKAKFIYKTLFIWPYAVAPALAGILWRFLFNPAVGVLAHVLQTLGYDWNYTIHWKQGLFLVILASSWQQFSYNFLFFLAGLQAIPRSLIEAAEIDGAGSRRVFWTIIFPLLSPITFFLIVVNLIYAFFNTFGVIQVITQGGPAGGTDILVYKVYNDGFMGLDLGGSSAQSVILMLIVLVLTVIQFRYIERKVHYA